MASWPSNLFLTIEYPHSQLVTTLTCNWWGAEMSMKDGWRSAREEVGGQCVMMIGMTLMQWWCADSLEYLQTVGHVPLMSLFFHMMNTRMITLHQETISLLLLGLQIHKQSLRPTDLALELDPSSWMMWTAVGVRQALMSALTEGLVSTTVITVKMQELSVPSEVNQSKLYQSVCFY